MPWPWSRRGVMRMISLGGRCETAFQLRRLGGAPAALPFDWWITPLAGVAGLLSSDPAEIFAPENLLLVEEYDGGPALYCHFVGTIHLHEVPPRGSLRDADPASLSSMLVAKYERLFERLKREAAQGRTLFVRQRLPDHDPQGAAELSQHIADIGAALSKLSPDNLLLLVDYPPVEAAPGVLQATGVASSKRALGVDWR